MLTKFLIVEFVYNQDRLNYSPQGDKIFSFSQGVFKICLLTVCMDLELPPGKPPPRELPPPSKLPPGELPPSELPPGESPPR